MKLSTKGRYGLRAILDIALHQDEGNISISAISERTGITVNYLEQLISKLRKAGIVISIRGAQGGYQLAKEMDMISVGDILRALEGDLAPVSCISDSEDECTSSNLCVAKLVWQRINDSISEAVDTFMLSELVSQSRKINPEQILMENNKC